MASPTAIKRKPLPTTSEDTEHGTVRDQLPAPEDSVSESVGNQSPAGDKPKDQGRVNRTKSQLNLWHKVALIAIIFGCTLVICGTIAYLSFLWFGGPSKTIWKSIVLANWAATSVAICGIVIRWWIPTGLPTGISFENTTQPINWHGASEDRITLFQHSLINMNSPALAIQSMIHTFVTDRFYKYMPLLEESTSQLTTYSTDAVFPVRTRGFIAVMVALGAHFILVAYTLIILSGFYDIKRTFRSTDQAWQVFTQVGRLQREVEREDPEVTVENAENGNRNFRWTTATDHQVEKHLKERGLKDRVFALEDNREDGSVYFRSKG